MIGINIGISICLAVLVIIAAIVVKGFIAAGSRKGRLNYVRNFKRGKCIVIYIAAIPLYVIGQMYAKHDFGTSFFGAIADSVDLIFLKCSLKSVQELVNASLFYTVTMYVAFALVLVNAIIFTASLLQQKIWQAVKYFFWRRGERDRLLIFGNNARNIITYRSADKKSCKKLLVGKHMTSEEKYDLFLDGVLYASYKSILKYIQKRLDKKIAKGKAFTQRTVIIVNTGDELLNVELCRKLIDIIEYRRDKKLRGKNEKAKLVKRLPEVTATDNEKEQKAKQEKELKARTVELFSRLRIYVLGDAANEALYREVVNNSHGCIHYVNMYNLAAVDFIDEYPIARFMDERHVDYSSSLVRNDVDINVTMIGFGDTNRQIFLASVANNQFLTADNITENGKERTGDDGYPIMDEAHPRLKPVHYHIFDREYAQNNKNLNHSYYRYRNEFFELDENDKPIISKNGAYVRPSGISQDNYLELPELPSVDDYYHLDINEPEFYVNLKNIFTHKRAGVNMVIVAYGNDLENIDLAQKMLEKKREWGISDLIMFVKVNSAENVTDIFKREDCFRIADYNRMFDISRIDNGKVFHMAFERNRLYAIEYELKEAKKNAAKHERERTPEKEDEHAVPFVDRIGDIISDADYSWFMERTQIERDSNIYCALSLRSKLLLMGLDYVENDVKNRAPISEEEYLGTYAKGDLPQYMHIDDEYKNNVLRDKKIVDYRPLEFKLSRRMTMATQEHYRWNSYMLSMGMIPADKDAIRTEKKHGKDYENRRRHGNLTTFDGLIEFRKMVALKKCGAGATAEALTASEIDNDVIMYDYQILDDAHWILNDSGYKIVKRIKAGDKIKA